MKNSRIVSIDYKNRTVRNYDDCVSVIWDL